MSNPSPFDDDWTPPAKAAPEPKPAASAKPARPRSDRPRAAYVAPEAEEDETEEEAIIYSREIADGIYFGMIDDAYHAIERLSTSGIQNMLVSPATFWANSWLNADRVEKPLKYRIYGRATHAARLEPELFAVNYARRLDKAEMPKGTLFTGNDMGAALAELGYAKSGSVAEQAERLRSAGYKGTVWQLELARWAEENKGRIGLSVEAFDDITTGAERLRASPKVADLLDGGASEVSIFWTCPATGIPMKARIDKLKPTYWVDLKTFDNTRGKVLAQAIADSFRYNRYYVQAVSYREPIEAIRNALVDIVGDATEAERDLIAAIQLSPAKLACWYVFEEKSGVPNIIARRFKFYDVPPSHHVNKAGLSPEKELAAAEAVSSPTLIARKAEVEIAHAKKLFLAYSEIYEPGEPWLPFDPLSDIGDEDFSPRWLEGMYE